MEPLTLEELEKRLSDEVVPLDPRTEASVVLAASHHIFSEHPEQEIEILKKVCEIYNLTLQFAKDKKCPSFGVLIVATVFKLYVRAQQRQIDSVKKDLGISSDILSEERRPN